MLDKLQNYTHRNGETDDPTEPGFYWFKGIKRVFDDDGFATNETEETNGVIEIEIRQEVLMLFNTVNTRNAFGFHIAGQWWGPLTPPWDAK